MNIFNSLTQSKSFTNVSIDTVMTAIKTGFLTSKNQSITTNAEEASKEDKYSTDMYVGKQNKYNYLKTNRVMTWCPNAVFKNNHRHNEQVDYLTGYVYCDIDGINPDTAKELLIKLPFVYSVWSSLSGTGVGFLVRADWSFDNFKANYKALSAYFLAEHNLELDKTSDFTRTNVFSYDPNYFHKEEATNIDSKTLSSYLTLTVAKNPRVAQTAQKIQKNTTTGTLSTYTQTSFERLIENLDVTVDYAAKVKIAINHATKSKGGFVDGCRHFFLTSLIGTANTMGIPYDILVEEFKAYLTTNGGGEAASLFEIEGFDNIYASFEGQKESVYSAFIKSVTIKNLVPTTKIKVEKYLDSQLPTVFTKNTLLVSPTGSGKSTYVIEQLKGKRIIVCPNTAVLRSFKSFKGVSLFYGEEKSENFTDIILTTQDSFELLTTVLDSRGENLIEYLIVVDEFHTLVSSANKGYKYKAINQTVAILEENPVIVLGLTATPITTVTSMFYQSFDIIQVEQAKDVTREIQLATYEDYRSFVIEKCLANKKSETITVVYKNSKKSVAVLKEALEQKGLTVAIINANTKETEEFAEIVENGNVAVDVILTTCLLKEGVSIKGKGENKIAVDYIVTGDNHYTEINQLASRVRNAETITITLAANAKAYKDYTLGFLLDNVIEDIDSANEFLIPRFNTEVYTEVEAKLDQKLTGSAIKYDELNYSFVVDNVYKDFLIYEAEKRVCTVNPLYTIINLLQDSRFEVFGTRLAYTQDNKVAVTEAKTVVELNNVEIKLDFKAIVDARPENITILERLDTIKETGTKAEQSMAYFTKFVYSRQKDKDLYTAIDKAEELNDSTRKFSEFNIKLELTELFTSGQGVNGVSTQFFNELRNTLKLDHQYTNAEIHDLMTAAAKKTDAKDFIKMTMTKSTQWFKLLGKVTADKTTEKKTRKTVIYFTLSGWGLDNYNYTPDYIDTARQQNEVVAFLASKHISIKNPYLGV